MPRSDDKDDRERGPSRAKPAGAPKKETKVTAGRKETPAVSPPRKAPVKKAAPQAAPSRTNVKTGPPAPPTPRPRRAPSTSAAAKPAKPARPRTPVKAAATAKPATSAPEPAGKAASQKAAKPAAPRRKTPSRKAGAPVEKPQPSVLDEEERIEDAKYLPRDLPPRLFEEERFIFPESYGQSRIRLLVKDPEWLFAHWDVDPQSLADLRAELGERASALSTLTLRVSDPQHGGESRVLLPEGARSWYIRADTTERSYRAQLGLTLPSGEFRSLAESNTVRTPRTGPAAGGSPRRARYDGVVLAPPRAAGRSGVRPPAGPSAPDPGPWRPDPSTTSYPAPGGAGAERPAEAGKPGRPGEPSGGASDVYRR